MFPDVEIVEVLKVWAAFTFPALIAWPFLERFFPGLNGGGWAIARTVGLFIWVYLCWLPSSISPIPYGDALVFVTGGCLLFGSVVLGWQNRLLLVRGLRTVWAAEAVFLGVFLAALAVAPFNGDLHPRAERFMDFAFLTRMALTTSFPPADSWLAGESAQYYYYGYLVMDLLRRVTDIELARFFNYALAANYALFAVAMFGAGLAVSRRKNVALAVVLVSVFGGNLYPWIHGFVTDWCGAASWFCVARVIPGTINEFPLFAYIWGDLHPYVIAFSLVATVLALAIALVRGKAVPLGVPKALEDSDAVRISDDVGVAEKGAVGSRIRAGLVGAVCALRNGLPPPGKNLSIALLMAILIGALFPTNSWDSPTFVCIALGALAWATVKGLEGRPLAARVGAALMAALVVGALSVLFYLPFNLSFGATQGGRGIFIVRDRSDILPFVTVWGCFFAFIFIWYSRSRRRNEVAWSGAIALGLLGIVSSYELWLRPLLSNSLGQLEGLSEKIVHGVLLTGHGWVIAAFGLYCLVTSLFSGKLKGGEQIAACLSAIGLGLVLFVEYFYLDDHYAGELARMNTVFKAYLQAWIVLSLGSVPLVLLAWERSKGIKKVFLGTILLVCTVGLSGTLFLEAPKRYSDFTRGNKELEATMDALAHFKRVFPADYKAIQWIRENTSPEAVVLEASAHAYEWAGRIATLTGRPTVLGWANHEAGWRNSWTEVNRRKEDIDQIYLRPDLENVFELLRSYGVDFVFVGSQEYESYGKSGMTGLRKFRGLPVVFEVEGAALFELPSRGENAPKDKG